MVTNGNSRTLLCLRVSRGDDAERDVVHGEMAVGGDLKPGSDGCHLGC
jgi:hypothetical protein